MAWLLVVGAGLLEVIWSSALKRAEGFQRPAWLVAGLMIAVASLGVLTLALRDLPVSLAYAVWVGIGSVGAAIAGIVLFSDRLSVGRALSIAAICAGAVGLTLLTA